MGLKSTSEISPSYPEVGRDEDLDDENDEDDVGGPHANCDVYAHRPLQAVGGNTHGLDGGERRFFARVDKRGPFVSFTQDSSDFKSS